MHIGGTGRGTGWAGIVELDLSDEPNVAAAVHGTEVVRVTADQPTHVFGPYHAGDAING